MSRVDLELIALIYALYGYECLHWLKEGEIAYTRFYSGTWKEWKHTELGFTLLHRLPCVVNLFPFASGFISFPKTSFSKDTVSTILRRVDQLSNGSQRSLRLASSLQAIVMLLVVPLAIGTQKLSHAWLPLLILALATHLVTVTLFVRNIQRWEKDRLKIFTDTLSVCLNPLAAIRSGDVLFERKFQMLAKQNRHLGGCGEEEQDVLWKAR